MTLRIERRWVLVSKKDKDLGDELKKTYDQLEPRVEKNDGTWTGPLGIIECRRSNTKPFVLPLDDLVAAVRFRMGYGKEISNGALKKALKKFVNDPENNFTMVRGRNGGVGRY